jgi:hypothetical protein
MSRVLFIVVLLLIAIVSLGILLHVRWDFFRLRVHPWLERHATLLRAYRSLGWLVTIPIVLIGGYHVSQQVLDTLVAPDLELVFGHPALPLFWVMNPSSKLAREGRYQFLLYDLSLPGNQEERLNLEIPVKGLDPIRPGRGLGPWTFQSVASYGSRIEQGHHLFGYAQVWCPTCEQVHFYWIFAHVGSAGWYVEIPLPKHRPYTQTCGPLLMVAPIS